MEEIKKVLEEENLTKAIGKLRLDKVEVSLNPKKYLVDFSKQELKKLEEAGSEEIPADILAHIEDSKKIYKDNIEKYANEKLEGVLVPLRYKDLQTIKDGILEAVKYSQEFNWDDDIKLKAMIREERTLTVYLSLRKKESIEKRYYDNLEQIAQVPESTIDELYNIYFTNFVLTEAERKNS